jgi:hypothetical protein
MINHAPTTIDALDALASSGKLHKLHTSLVRTYVSRKTQGIVIPYQGKYGIGYKVLTPNFRSCRYSFVTYYITNGGAA